jgi:hypothetical protein
MQFSFGQAPVAIAPEGAPVEEIGGRCEKIGQNPLTQQSVEARETGIPP